MLRARWVASGSGSPGLPVRVGRGTVLGGRHQALPGQCGVLGPTPQEPAAPWLSGSLHLGPAGPGRLGQLGDKRFWRRNGNSLGPAEPGLSVLTPRAGHPGGADGGRTPSPSQIAIAGVAAGGGPSLRAATWPRSPSPCNRPRGAAGAPRHVRGWGGGPWPRGHLQCPKCEKGKRYRCTHST